jgi:hypothetical protein
MGVSWWMITLLLRAAAATTGLVVALGVVAGEVMVHPPVGVELT